MTKTMYKFNYWEMNNKQQSCTKDDSMSRTQEQKRYILVLNRGIIVHIFTILPQFRITVFISTFVRIHGVSFQNKHICLAIYGPQCVSHLRVRMNKLNSRGSNSEHLGNIFLFVWAYKIKCICFENNFCLSLLAKSQDKVR